VTARLSARQSAACEASLAAVLAVSLLFAPAARAEEAPVKCTVNHTSFWTTSGICYPLIAEARVMTEMSGVTSRNDLLQLCEIDLRAKFPGANRPTYLNACEQLLAALQLP
jgi:hypothetical protein